MCGIAGYIGKQQAAPIILDWLSKLEYRGYDSAGIAVFDGQKIHFFIYRWIGLIYSKKLKNNEGN